MLFLLVIGITIKEPGPPFFFVEGIISLPEPTADLTGAPNLGCYNAAACSISPSTPTIAPFPKLSISSGLTCNISTHLSAK